MQTSNLVAKKKVPETFRQEIKEYIGLLVGNEDNSSLVGKELLAQEQEDKMAENALKNMQEHGIAPFGPGFSMSKEDYARQLAEIEE